ALAWCLATAVATAALVGTLPLLRVVVMSVRPPDIDESGLGRLFGGTRLCLRFLLCGQLCDAIRGLLRLGGGLRRPGDDGFRPGGRRGRYGLGSRFLLIRLRGGVLRSLGLRRRGILARLVAFRRRSALRWRDLAGRRHERHGDRRAWAAVHDIAERLLDRREI